MAYARWYPTLTTLPDGRALVTSGDATTRHARSSDPEIYDPAADTWTPTAKKRAVAVPVHVRAARRKDLRGRHRHLDGLLQPVGRRLVVAGSDGQVRQLGLLRVGRHVRPRQDPARRRRRSRDEPHADHRHERRRSAVGGDSADGLPAPAHEHADPGRREHHGRGRNAPGRRRDAGGARRRDLEPHDQAVDPRGAR